LVDTPATLPQLVVPMLHVVRVMAPPLVTAIAQVFGMLPRLTGAMMLTP
jgi:hypothetical protein